MMSKLGNLEQTQSYLRAKKRIEVIKKFYKHLMVYLAVNLFFIGRRIYKDIQYNDEITEAFLNLNNYKLFFWWAIALMLHAVATFGVPMLFSKNWEEQKIKEIMNK